MDETMRGSMADVLDKNRLTIGKASYKVADLCSYIATTSRTKKRVTYVADRNGGRFKAGNRTVALFDGKRIISTSTNKAMGLLERLSSMPAMNLRVSNAPNFEGIEPLNARPYLNPHVNMAN